MPTCAERSEDWISPGGDANLRASGATTGSVTPEPDGACAARRVQEEQRPFWLKAFDVASVSALLVLLNVAVARLVPALGEGGAAAWILLPACAAAVLAADLVSGLVHWICDRFFAEDTPLIGRMLIHPFREHHVDPMAITRHGLFELCGNNALAVLLPVLALLLAGPPRPSASSLALHGFVIAFSFAVFATNLMHKWAHAVQCRAVVRWLQRTRLILSPEVHDRHHRGDFSHGYCVTTGWLNPLLDASRVLPRSEAWLRSRRRRFARTLLMRPVRVRRIRAGGVRMRARSERRVLAPRLRSRRAS
ncbi:fatty acid desaturase family protein [Candidatus Binatia bacterium]|jgi:ubiquitin-conjugating enzyme E2 variant|nr:fatty acid desaturase family protein [Candidatus Binatia bacterium]